METTILLPQSVQKYFWGDNLEELSWEHHQRYIIQTLLDIGDITPLHWLFSVASRERLRALLPSLKLSAKSANFWNIYLS